MIKKQNLIVLFTILLCLLFSGSAFANSAEPPSFTVIVSMPPEGLNLSLKFPNGIQTEPLVLSKEVKAWEAYYRFFYHSYPGSLHSFDGAVLIIEHGNEQFQCSLPAESFETYNNLLTLDISTQTIVSGQSSWRIPTLIAIRLLLTLLSEGFVFSLFGYRNRKSWVAFALINLATQGFLNAFLTGPQIGSYWLLVFFFGEVIVFFVEMITFASLVREFSKRKAVLYAVVANAFSLIVGGLLIAYLPI